MTTDIIDLNNFTVLIEQAKADKTIIKSCEIDTDVVGFAFYGSGNVNLEIRHNQQTKYLSNTTGLAISFFGNEKVEFLHKISADRPLQSISIFTKIKHFGSLSTAERANFEERLPQLLNPAESFVQGPALYMNLEMQQVVQKVFNNQYQGNTRLLFLRSQVNELMAHFFALISNNARSTMADTDKDKLYYAREIINNDLAKPPSITQLSKQIGLNSTKLKKNFKELFGVPVYRYLQEERLKKAYELLNASEMNVQETSWYVGYESLSSFSNAFYKRFGTRPNEVRQQAFSNKS